MSRSAGSLRQRQPRIGRGLWGKRACFPLHPLQLFGLTGGGAAGDGVGYSVRVTRRSGRTAGRANRLELKPGYRRQGSASVDFLLPGQVVSGPRGRHHLRPADGPGSPGGPEELQAAQTRSGARAPWT